MACTNQVLKTCFISAPFAADLGALPSILDKRGIQWEWAKLEPSYSERLPGDLRRIIRRVNFVAAVLIDPSDDPNILYEVGIAVGIGKPVFLILPIDRQVPLKLIGFPHVRAPLKDEKAISFHLDMLIRYLNMSEGRFRYPVTEQLPSSVRRPSTSPPGHKRQEFRNLEPSNQLETEIVDLIEQSGGQVLLQSPDAKLFTPDLLVWFPEQRSDLINPAVIELKGHRLSLQELGQLEDQLVAFLEGAGVRTGVIVAPNVEDERPTGFRGNPAMNVFFIDLDRFRQLLRTGRLAEHLRQERNRAAHGLR
jgi:hypothetical protein